MAAISLRAAAHSAERCSGAVPLAAPKSKLRILIGLGGPARPREGRAARGHRRTGQPPPTPLRSRPRAARTRCGSAAACRVRA
eukprot:13492430-Alexandrium_andersonii.AAC.1